ncbi:MAG: histidinol-phosphate transaminase [Acidimicrobiales bacterium]
MSACIPLRAALLAHGGYRSTQVPAAVRLNTNESPFPPPPGWQEELAATIEKIDFHRYPDRDVTELREGIAALHAVTREEVFCANGSNEVLQCLLLAFGGPGRTALVFEPTYALHSHIAELTGTGVHRGARDAAMRIDPATAGELLGSLAPEIVFACSPNNPTGRSEDPLVVRHLTDRAPGLVVVDEAYGQFSRFTALDLRDGSPGAEGLVVVRTFSKTWAMAGARLGYLVAAKEVVEGCRRAALPYHVSVQTQAAGLLALGHATEMEDRVRAVAEARESLAAGLGSLDVETWPSDANFCLFRPRRAPGHAVWEALVARGVLVRDFSALAGLEGSLRVTVGTPEENGRFLDVLAAVLDDLSEEACE